MLSVNGLILMFLLGIVMTHFYYLLKNGLMIFAKYLIDEYLYRVCICHHDSETNITYETKFCNYMRELSDKLYYRLRFMEYGI